MRMYIHIYIYIMIHIFVALMSGLKALWMQEPSMLEGFCPFVYSFAHPLDVDS